MFLDYFEKLLLNNRFACLFRTIAASQMEVYYARETFPCFDEPGLKATFDISMQHEASNYALSNMDVKSIVRMTFCVV